MTTLEDMRAYIARVDNEITWGRYELGTMEILALGKFAEQDLFQALHLAYKYGRAQGARCAMRRAKRPGLISRPFLVGDVSRALPCKKIDSFGQPSSN